MSTAWFMVKKYGCHMERTSNRFTVKSCNSIERPGVVVCVVMLYYYFKSQLSTLFHRPSGREVAIPKALIYILPSIL